MAGRRARRQHPHDEPATLGEPARRDGGAEHQRGDAAAGADDDAPQQHELPGLRHERGQSHAGRDQSEGRRSCGAAEPVHHRRGERADQPVKEILTATAKDIVARDHPNSFSSGTIRTPGVARTPAAASKVRR